MGFEDGVDVPGGASGVIGERHGRPAEHIKIGYDSAPGETITEPPESVFDRSPVEKRGVAQATSSSCGWMKTPRRRKDAGA